MASDGIPATPPATGPVSVNQTRDTTSVHPSGGKVLPPSGTTTPPKSAAAIEKAIAPTAAKATAVTPSAPSTTTPKAVHPDKPSEAHALVTQLNKSINHSGRPDQFRLSTSAGAAVIQQINPASGEVVGEYSEEEFPTLAQGLGVSGGLVDTSA